MYDLSSVLDFDEIQSVEPGSSILISGPAMTGKEAIAHEILADGLRSEEGAIAVTTNDEASDIYEDFQGRVPELSPTQLGLIDCRGDGDHDSTEGAYTHHVSSPGDLTGIGIGITKALEGLHTSGYQDGRLALVSLSTMLTYTDKKTVFKFCHVLSSRLDSADYIGLFTIDSSAHDEQTVQVIKQAFDGLIELREGGDGREARVLGIGDKPSDWKSI